jgi:hypothetical protein
MRLLFRNADDEYQLTEVNENAIPPYAILSHTWFADEEEPTFQDLTNGTGKEKLGYEKIRFCGERARQDGLQYFWVDTCCINKENYAELSHSINSMFLWYRKATQCYVHLRDVSINKRNASERSAECTWESAFRSSKWFTRGWTLQELLAPASVVFFSNERKQLGDKWSLEQQIHEITGVPKLALQGVLLSQFTVHDRLSWINPRQTKREEDKAYSLLGILGVHMAPLYGEGMAAAFRRLQDEVDKMEKCAQDLRVIDPRDDKRRIEETKGGLLKDSYRWILDNSQFQDWRSDQQQGSLLWIKGDPGKGKTMLLCGIIDELNNSIANTALLSYFFCQATDSRINNATAILRGLIYMLISQQPSLVSHIRKKYDHAGKSLFEDTNAWVALVKIFTDMLQDPHLNKAYLIIDALDECVTDLPKLLNFIIQKSSSSHIKWIVSSRNWPDIKEQLENACQNLSLELNAQSISTAVEAFIKHKVLQLTEQKKYNDRTQDAVLDHLSSNANNTFLWVALVCQTLAKIPQWKPVKLGHFPPGLDDLYGRMVEQIRNLDDEEDTTLCRRILTTITLAYRPLTLEELASLVETLEDMANDPASLREIIGLCGSLLTVREDTVYFVHQSAKDYLLEYTFDEICPSGPENVHYSIFLRSLQILSKTLRRDMYCLQTPGYPIDQIEPPHPDPLAASRYSCIYWVDHLYNSEANSIPNHDLLLRYERDIKAFLKDYYLYWLEALSICGGISNGVISIAKLEALVQVKSRYNNAR